MKKIIIQMWMIVLLLSLTACGNTSSMENSQSENNQDISTEQENDVDTLAFWLEKIDNPSKVLLPLEEIQAQNALMLQTWGSNWLSGYYDVQAVPDTVDREWLQERIEYPNVKNLTLYSKGELVTAEMWQEYYKNYNFDAMPEQVRVRYGVIVHPTAGYDFPIADIMTGSSLDEKENLLQQTFYRMNEPVVVLWESADQEWYYVVANEFIGWIEAKDCGLFETREEWVRFQEKEEFLVVSKDMTVEGIEGTVYMSTKLYLIESDEPHDMLFGDYVVRVPQRGENGWITYTYAALSTEDPVHQGYLPYTVENILTLAFQELGDSYGWGGIDGKRDCSMYVKDIYNCFGFQMPRNSRIQMTIPQMSTQTDAMSVEEKESLLSETNPGSVLGISGHVMLYLGEDNGQHYVISMLGSYIPEDVTEDFRSHIVSAQKVMINTLDVHRGNGNTWLQEIIAVVDAK